MTALEDHLVVEALRPVAEAVGEAHASAWWSKGIALDDQVLVDRREDGAQPLRLTGAATVLAEWKKQIAQSEKRLRNKHISGAWWSPPIWSLSVEEAKRWGADRPELSRTTRSLPGLGAIGLLLEEDGLGTPSALCRSVRCRRPPNVFEIRDAEDWLGLTERYPTEVTWSRRGNWHAATGLNGRWMLPDWALVAQEYDAVHLSLMGYLAISGRALKLDAETATLIAGWNADETYWLTEALTLAGEPTKWVATEHNPPRAWRPASQDEG